MDVDIVKELTMQLTELSKKVNNLQGIQAEILQPWSTFVMKVKMPTFVLNKMLKITDEIIADYEELLKTRYSWEDVLEQGLLQTLPFVEHETLEREGLMSYFLDVTRHFVIQQTLQANPLETEEIKNDEWATIMRHMWIVSQRDDEYQPCHIHPDGHVSTVMYLKIPEYLHSSNLQETYLTPEAPQHINKIQEPPKHRHVDGAITFMNNSTKDPFWGHPRLTISPEVGDLFIFPSSQQHLVYPFRTAKGKESERERRSVSFNVIFSSKLMKTEQERQRKIMKDHEKGIGKA